VQYAVLQMFTGGPKNRYHFLIAITLNTVNQFS